MQFNEVINLITQAFLEKQSIANFLIEYYGNDDFSDELSNIADEYLYLKIKFKSDLTEFQKGIIITALTNIALTKYLNGNFYNPVRATFNKCYEEYNDQTVEKHIREILEPFKQFVRYADTTSHVAVPLVTCVVPHYRLGHLFNIAFDIYKKNLRLDPDLSFVQTQQKVSQIFDAFVRKDLVNSTNDTIKGTNYWMSTFTQTCIKEKVYLDDLISITANCIEIIKNYIWDYKINGIPPFYEEAFSSWKSLYDNDDKNKNDKSTIVSRARFTISADHLYLTTKAISVSDRYDPNNIFLVINGQKFEMDDIDYGMENDTVGGELIINEKTIDLLANNIDVFDNFKYQIFCGDEEIFSSEQTLNREILFFSPFDNKEVKPGTDYEGDLICISKKTTVIPKTTVLYRNQNYIVSQLYVQKSDSLLISDKVYVFCSEKGQRVLSQMVDWIYFEDITGGKVFNIFKSFDGILFETSFDASDLAIYDQDILLSNVEIILNKTSTNYINSFLLKANTLNDGYHSLQIVNRKNQKMIKGTKAINFVLDRKISKEVIPGDDSAIVVLKSGLFEEKAYDYDYKSNEIVTKGYVKDLINGLFHINPEIPLYSIDDRKTWRSTKERIYFSNIKNYGKTIYIKGFNELQCTFMGGSVLKQLSIEKSENTNEYVIHLSGLLTYKDQEHISINLVNGIISVPLFVDFIPLIDSSKSLKKYKKENNLHIFKYYFGGPEKILCKVYFSSPSEPICSFIIESGQEFHPYELEPFTKYKIGLFVRSGGLSFDSKPFYSDEYYFCDSTKLSGRSFRIIGADIEQVNRGLIKRNEIPVNYDNWYLRFVGKDKYNFNDSDCYFGLIFDNQPNRYISMRPVKNIAIKVLGFKDQTHLWVEIKQYLVSEIIDSINEAKRNGDAFVLDPDDPDYYSLVMLNIKEQKFIEEDNCDANKCFLEKILISLKEEC